MRPRPSLRKTRRTVQHSSAARPFPADAGARAPRTRFPACCPSICRRGPGRHGAPVGEAGGVSIAVIDLVWAKAPTSGNEPQALLAPADACSRDAGTGAPPPARHGL